MSKKNMHSPSPMRNHTSKYQHAIRSRRFTDDTGNPYRLVENRRKYETTGTLNRRRSTLVEDHTETDRKSETSRKFNGRRSSYVDDQSEKETTRTFNRRRSSYVDDPTEKERKNEATRTVNCRRSSYVDDHTKKERKSVATRIFHRRRSSYVDDNTEKEQKHDTTRKLNGRRSTLVENHTENESKFETTGILSRRRSILVDTDKVFRDEVSKPKKRVTFADDIFESKKISSNVGLGAHTGKKVPSGHNTFVDDTYNNKRKCMNANVETSKPSSRNTFVDYIDENREKNTNHRNLKLKRRYSYVDNKENRRYERFESPKYRRRDSQCLDSKSNSPTRFRAHRSPKPISKQLKTSTKSQRNGPIKMIRPHLPLCVSPASWSGSISFGGLFKIDINIEPIGGYYFQFNHLTEHNLNICCGIYQTAVWKCMENLLKSKKKDVSVVLIKPTNTCDMSSYNYWFYYFHTRGQVAHISFQCPNMSFFHVLPLPAGQGIADTILKNFKIDPSSLEFVPRCNTLLGLMILKPSCDMSYISIKRKQLPLPWGYSIHPMQLSLPEGSLHRKPSTSSNAK